MSLLQHNEQLTLVS